MKLPYFLLHLLPLWSYICPRCKREVRRKSHKCPFCGEKYGKPLKVPPLFLKNRKALEEYVHKHVFPRISAKQREYLAQFFTEFLNSGWEDSGGTDITDNGKWDGESETSGADLSVSSANPHHGSYHARLETTGQNTYETAYVYKNLNEESVVYCRAYFYFHDLSQNRGPTCIVLRGDNRALAYCRLKAGSTLQSHWTLAYRNNGAEESQHTTEGFPSENTWVCVELYVKIGNGDGEAKLYVDGTEILSATGLTNDDKGNVDRVEVGGRDIGYNPTITMDFDCVVIADTYIGEETGITEVSVLDSAVGVETITRSERQMEISDSALGTEILSKIRNLSLFDIATGLEMIQKARDLGTITDSAIGLEEILKRRLIELHDSALGQETILRPTRITIVADEAFGSEIIGKLRELTSITDSAMGIEYVSMGTEGTTKTKIFLLLGDLAIQLTGN